MKSAPFRFDAESHVYIALDTGEIVPNITRMLDAVGLIDDRWYTEESCERGKEIHRLTANFDMGAVDMAALVSPYRPYLLGHVEVVKIARPEMLHVEVGAVHPTLRFGGRPDRVLKVYQRRGVWEIKSGGPEKSHPVQTALQAILAAEELELPAQMVTRHCEYLKRDGGYKVEEHKNPRDFDFAYTIIDAVTKNEVNERAARLRREYREYYPEGGMMGMRAIKVDGMHAWRLAGGKGWGHMFECEQHPRVRVMAINAEVPRCGQCTKDRRRRFRALERDPERDKMPLMVGAE